MKRRHERWIKQLSKNCDYDAVETEQTIRTYDAELYGDATNEGVLSQKQVEQLVYKIGVSDWFQRRWPVPTGTEIKIIWRAPQARWAWGSPTRIEIPNNSFGRSIHTIVHEMAHAATGALGHGPKFLKALLYLTRHYEGIEYARQLKKRLRETGALKR